MLDRATELKKYQTYINGKWVDAASGKTFQTFDPYTAEPWALIPECEKADVDMAVEAAARAFETGPWSALTQTGYPEIGFAYRLRREILAVVTRRPSAPRLRTLRRIRISTALTGRP